MIHVQDLVKTFGEVKAVDHISFDVSEGEIFAFLGPNGAGKTTTIQMLTTLVQPTSGSIALDGIDPRQHPHDVRRRFGIVFQDPSLDGELTAYENLDLHGVLYHVPKRTRVERIERLLKLFELWDRPRLQNMQGFQLIMNFLVMPIYFLSGALYPLNNLPVGLRIADAPRSADLRHRRPARRLHRRLSLQHRNQCGGAVGGRRGFPGARRTVVCQDPDLIGR